MGIFSELAYWDEEMDGDPRERIAAETRMTSGVYETAAPAEGWMCRNEVLSSEASSLEHAGPGPVFPVDRIDVRHARRRIRLYLAREVMASNGEDVGAWEYEQDSEEPVCCPDNGRPYRAIVFNT